MTIDRGSMEIETRLKDLVVCGDAVVTFRGDATGDVEVLEAATLKLYGNVAGDLAVNTAGRVDVHGNVDGDVRVEAGVVRIIGSIGSLSGPHADGVKLCTGCVVAGERRY